jgi:hypothetical protein
MGGVKYLELQRLGASSPCYRTTLARMANVLPGYRTSEGYLSGVSAEGITGEGITVFQRRALEKALWAYGEDAALEAVVAGLDAGQVRAIGVRHYQLTYQPDPDKRSGEGYAFDKALALSAVEVLEGRHRLLARKRRRTNGRPG